MTTLAEFLLACIDDDEEAAHAGGHPVGWVTFRNPDGSMHHTALGSWDEEGWLVDGRLVQDDTATAFYDPARVLADCDAKRRIVMLHHCAPTIGDPWDPVCTIEGHGVTTPNDCDTLRALALPYADRPDYREEWRP